MVSVIIPNYNYAQYIGLCLQSVLDSDYDQAKMEIIVVDDASTDDSAKVVEEIMKDSRFPLRLIINETNLGLISSRNLGIAHACGEFLFFLDSDNYIGKDCVKNHLIALQQNPEAIACYAPIQEFLHSNGEPCDRRSNQPFGYRQLLEGPYIDAMAMFRKKELIKAGKYNNKMPSYGWEDYELWLRLGKQNKKVIFIEGEPLSFYRVHQLNKSQNFKPDEYNHLVYYLKQHYPVKQNLLQSEALDSLIHQKKYTAQLFYQADNAGFDEQNSILNHIDDSPFHFKLPAGKAFQQLRFDPVNDFAVVKLYRIRFFNVDGEIFPSPKITSNADEVEDATYYFSNPDPRIIIGFDEAVKISEVEVYVKYLKTGADVFCEIEKMNNLKAEKIINLTQSNQHFKDQLAQKVAELDKISDELNQKIVSDQKEINRLQIQDATLRSELIKIKSSFSYKIAKHTSLVNPVRFVRQIKEKIRLTKSIRLISESSLFDEEYYWLNNPDVKKLAMNPAKHYLFYGGFEGRNPSEKFDSSQYLETFPDVKLAGMNPLLHYVKFGKNEDRQPAKPPSVTNIKSQADKEEFQEHTLNDPENLIVKNPRKLKSFFFDNNGHAEFINEYFDRIYVINLRRRQNKLVEITQKLKRLNISVEIIEAIDGYEEPHIDEYEAYKNNAMGYKNAHPEEIKLNRKLIYSPGVWGHLKSNRLILKDALAKGYEKILILEDDVMFMKNFHHEFKNFIGIISGKSWKFLYLGATQASWDIPGSIIYPDKSLKTFQPDQPFYHPVSTFGSFALAIHHSQFKGIINKIDEMNCPFDWIFKLSFNQFSEQSFVAQPNLIIAGNAESDNRPEKITSEQKLLALTRRKWDLTKYD